MSEAKVKKDLADFEEKNKQLKAQREQLLSDQQKFNEAFSLFKIEKEEFLKSPGKCKYFYQKSAATTKQPTDPAVGAFINRGKETPGSVGQGP